MHFDLPNWVVPVGLLAVSAGVALVKMWSAQQIQAQRSDTHAHSLEDVVKRLDAHDTKFAEHNSAIATILEGIEWIKKALGGAR